jgi:hypothetical protein
MGAPRIPVSKIRRLAALHVLDRIPSISSIAKIISVAKTTVVKYRGFIKASGFSFSDFATLLPGEMDAIFDQLAMRHRKSSQRYATLLAILPQIQANTSPRLSNCVSMPANGKSPSRSQSSRATSGVSFVLAGRVSGDSDCLRDGRGAEELRNTESANRG